jgi:uncharacterized membrane protein HdeD (DUF308 family)
LTSRRAVVRCSPVCHFIWPGRTLLVISVVLAWFLVFKGIVDIIVAFSNHGGPGGG